MSNPTTLQELADSLAELSQAAIQRAKNGAPGLSAPYHVGYSAALQDTRATVLAMIQDINRRIAANNQVVEGFRPDFQRENEAYQALLDGRIEAYQDVINGGTDETVQPDDAGECPTCGAQYGEMDHAPEPCLTQAEMDEQDWNESNDSGAESTGKV